MPRFCITNSDFNTSWSPATTCFLNLTFSALYLSHVKHVNFVAKEKGFESALDMYTYKEEVSKDIIYKNIES